MYHSVAPESDASRPVAGSTNMSVLKTRTLLRPAAHNLSLSLVETRSFESFEFGTFSTHEPSTSGDDNGSTALPSVRSHLDHESVLSVTPWKSSKRTLLSALPTGSVYSQESCTYQTTPARADTRRFAIALESLDLWPLATSPLSASVGAFILNLRKPNESQEITPPSVNFVAETALNAPYLVTSPKSFDATIAMLDEITTCFQTPAGEQNSLALLLQPSRDSAVAFAASAYEYKGDTASGTSASTLENGVKPGKGNPLLPTRGLGGLLSRISLPITKPHTSTAAVISSILDGSVETVSMVPRQDTASLVKRHRTLRKRPPSTPRKQTFRREQASLLAQGSSTIPTQEFRIPPLPAISISPLAVSFEAVKDKITEYGSNTPIPHGDWETIGVAF